MTQREKRCSARQRHRMFGFTLTELLLTVVISGILASIALVSYQKTIERNRWQTAGDILMTIYAGMRSYFLQNGFYYDVDETGGMAEWRKIHVDDPNLASIPIGYVVSTPVTSFPQLFTATGTRNGGACSTKTRTINHNRVLTSGVCWSSCGC